MASPSRDDRLQQYFDGELTDAEAAELRAAIEEDEALQGKLEGLAHLRTMLVSAAEERGDEIDSEALWSGISARLGEGSELDDDPMLPPENDEVSRPGLSVVKGGKKAASARPAAGKPARGNNVVWIGVASVIALAAAVLLVVMRPFDLGSGTTPQASAPPPGSEVVEVDFGYNTGAIFSVEGQEGEHYAVVWISDEKPDVDEEGVERIQ